MTIVYNSNRNNLISGISRYRWEFNREVRYTRKGKTKKGRRRLKRAPKRTEKDDKMYIGHFLCEIWNSLPPKMIEQLRHLLVEEFGMSEEEADDFIRKQKDCAQTKEEKKLKRKPYCPPETRIGVRHKWIKDFCRIFANKITDYVVMMLCCRRTPRVRKLAEAILNHFCEITGEKTTLNTAKTKMQRIQVFIADRIAVWLDSLIKESEDKKMKDEAVEARIGVSEKPKRITPRESWEEEEEEEKIKTPESKPPSKPSSKVSSKQPSEEGSKAGSQPPSKPTSRPPSKPPSKPSSKESSKTVSKQSSKQQIEEPAEEAKKTTEEEPTSIKEEIKMEEEEEEEEEEEVLEETEEEDQEEEEEEEEEQEEEEEEMETEEEEEVGEVIEEEGEMETEEEEVEEEEESEKSEEEFVAPPLFPPLPCRDGGLVYQITKDGSKYNVRQLSSGSVARKVAKARNREVPVKHDDVLKASTHKPLTESPMNLQTMKEWADWAAKAAEVAQRWTQWVDTTVAEVEEKSQMKKGKIIAEDGRPLKLRKEDWQKWQAKTKRAVDEIAKTKHEWKKDAATWKMKTEKAAQKIGPEKETNITNLDPEKYDKSGTEKQVERPEITKEIPESDAPTAEDEKTVAGEEAIVGEDEEAEEESP
ncbi:uncharacterized protein LOC142327896 isoform X2 [Lycorma delicatula]|uniref:uncharacterized protein LOC142327896 isoform X2 n=1 Tax=Lycorma delicatula TaxID=130591 RepID=UPI003F513EE6